MNKFFKFLVLASLCVSLSGCKEMMMGEWHAPENPPIPTFPEQEAIWSEYVQYYYPNWTKHYWVDRELWGNRGYIYGGPKEPASVYIEEREKNLVPVISEESEEVEEVIEKPVMEDIPLETIELQSLEPKLIKGNKIYLVVKGDNLWNIAAKPEIYQDPLKWPIIYNSNRDIIDDPDLIYPGQQLIVPDDSSF